MKSDKLAGFKVGTNLGGWLSQYEKYDHAHFKAFIKEDNISQIASWGMDHVRLPVDYPLFEDDEKPFAYKESGFDYVNQCLEWCEKHGLNLVIDLHRAPGFTFDSHETCSLFDKPEQQQRFISLWKEIARRFSSKKKPGIIFELLNEIALPSSDPWNRLAAKTIKSIREIDSGHLIMVGGNDWNATWALKDLPIFDDAKMVYTFHFYEPLPFTHQRASWLKESVAYDKILDYPGELPGLAEFLDKNQWCRKRFDRYNGVHMDKDFLKKDLEPALDFISNNGLPLYCGEFGVIEISPRKSLHNWYRDFVGLLKENNIGRACWSYKGMNFSLVDYKNKIVDEELIKIVSGTYS
ncbi:MAG TPA: endoglucanase [Lentisphaeria bacterium]|nr:MAG: endoglucanase [Lentisphaerae bacterium GWF2_50_93]HCE46214.1 endoglucanase [Lentisphaeria bacterium]